MSSCVGKSLIAVHRLATHITFVLPTLFFILLKRRRFILLPSKFPFQFYYLPLLHANQFLLHSDQNEMQSPFQQALPIIHYLSTIFFFSFINIAQNLVVLLAKPIFIGFLSSPCHFPPIYIPKKHLFCTRIPHLSHSAIRIAKNKAAFRRRQLCFFKNKIFYLPRIAAEMASKTVS